MKIRDIRKNLEAARVYTEEDINTICILEAKYMNECDAIAKACEKEGYPSHGSNYELRCESARKYYDEQIALIDAKYEEE